MTEQITNLVLTVFLFGCGLLYFALKGRDTR